MHRTTNILPTFRRRQVYTLDRKMFSWNIHPVRFPFLPHKSMLIFGSGKDNDICPQNLSCCEGTITAFEDTTQIPSILNHQKSWNQPWKAHSDQYGSCSNTCSNTDVTAQTKIINSQPKAKAVAAKAVKKILHKAAHKNGPISPPDQDDYWGEHEDLVKIWKQILHLLETPEGQTPKIVT